MNITEFLEARIAEDESEAQNGGYHNASGVFARDNYGCLLIQPARVLAECAAKREVIKQAEEADSDTEYAISQSCIGDEADAARAMSPGKLIREALAAVYADHPDYRQEWAQHA